MIRGLVQRLLGEGTHSGHSLGEFLGPEGAPRGAPDTVAKALLTHLHTPPESDDVSAVVGALHALSLIEGTLGWLPGGTEQATGTDSIMHRLRCQAEAIALPCPASGVPGTDWRAWAWRASGCAVAHASVCDKPSRVWVSPGGLQWDWGQSTLLSIQAHADHQLQSARVDGLRFKAVQSNDQCSMTTEARKARIFISTSGLTAVNWNLSWRPTATSDGLQATQGERVLIGKLDPAWSWNITDTGVQGSGSTAMRCSFELR